MKDDNKKDANIFTEQNNVDFRGVDFELGPPRVQYSPHSHSDIGISPPVATQVKLIRNSDSSN